LSLLWETRSRKKCSCPEPPRQDKTRWQSKDLETVGKSIAMVNPLFRPLSNHGTGPDHWTSLEPLSRVTSTRSHGTRAGFASGLEHRMLWPRMYEEKGSIPDSKPPRNRHARMWFVERTTASPMASTAWIEPFCL
jgi:hypothetical protein